MYGIYDLRVGSIYPTHSIYISCKQDIIIIYSIMLTSI
ncbi:hypothetical protein BOVA115_2253 [Bacteroides ovatus]|nr:hypothetical protein BOVA115_2253 [Bacteroides ovatus]